MGVPARGPLNSHDAFMKGCSSGRMWNRGKARDWRIETDAQGMQREASAKEHGQRRRG